MRQKQEVEMPLISEQDQATLDRVVKAAKRIMYDEKVLPMLEAGMAKETPVPQKLATEAAGLLKMVQDKANGGIPKQLLVPAGMMVMIEMADFMEQAGMEEIEQEDISAAIKILVIALNKVFGKGNQEQPQEPQEQQPEPQMPPGQPQPQMPQGGLIQQQPQMMGA
jgi:hypothetical protein